MSAIILFILAIVVYVFLFLPAKQVLVALVLQSR